MRSLSYPLSSHPGFEIQMDSSSTAMPSADAIKSALAEINVNVKDITAQSNISAFVTFDTLHRVSQMYMLILMFLS
jgi:hypothetical protein